LASTGENPLVLGVPGRRQPSDLTVAWRRPVTDLTAAHLALPGLLARLDFIAFVS